MSPLNTIDEVCMAIRCAPESQLGPELAGKRKELHDALNKDVRQGIARLEAERDGWQKIACELLVVAFGEEGRATGYIPPLELLEARDKAHVVAALAQWWANLTFNDSERRSKKEHWREKAAVVESSLRLRRAILRDRRDRPRAMARAQKEWRRDVDALLEKFERDRVHQGGEP